MLMKNKNLDVFSAWAVGGRVLADYLEKQVGGGLDPLLEQNTEGPILLLEVKHTGSQLQTLLSQVLNQKKHRKPIRTCCIMYKTYTVHGAYKCTKCMQILTLCPAAASSKCIIYHEFKENSTSLVGDLNNLMLLIVH